ncbi:hypothetical protein D5085_13120 [Ectothiorhodospiraceae bacterium BW-2]|nr:hypothetical protein D5085_13120 [Ectothiorhodospiraceae bacterium BW-2]
MDREFIQQARTIHEKWFDSFMQSIINHQGQLDQSVAIRSEECDLGRWLKEEGLKKYPHLNEMNQLDHAHRNLHLHVEKLLDRQQLYMRSRYEYGQIEQAKDRLVELLVALEQKI